MNPQYPIIRPGIIVSQPFGEFFVTTIPARVLLEIAFSDRLKAIKQRDGTYRLSGSQRILAETRLGDIGKFIDMPSAVFPNTIILAANYREEDGLIEGEEHEEDEKEIRDEKKWRLDRDSDGVTANLIIPTADRLAAVIDGQHRLFGFKFIADPERLDFQLLCAIYFDLPKPYQAFLFATVNANQRPVSKSQTYELFGYNVEDEPLDKWTPEKLAVFLTRRLNVEEDSPFHGHILVPAENDFLKSISEHRREKIWAVSIATVVEGIVKLISSNPKQDAYEMHGTDDYKGGSRSSIKNKTHDLSPPLREIYLAGHDDLIYKGVKNFFTAVNKVFWSEAKEESLIRKTVGIQALFDVARSLMKKLLGEKNFSTQCFEKELTPAADIDFSDPFFQTSGTGRLRIRATIELRLNLRGWSKIAPRDFHHFIRIVGEEYK